MTQKPYKCRVEYLESTGTQYIDTGVVFSNSSHTYKWDIGAQAVNTGDTNYNWFCGLFEGGANSAGTYADTTTNYRFYAIGTYYQNGQVITSPLTNGDKYGIIRNVFTITNFAGTLPIILFGRNQSNGVKCEATKKIFYYKIYDNDILIRDFIPVLDNSGRPAMYDQVSGQLFYNQGTGEFTYGRQIIPVEYLESTGEQYIDTGYIPSNTTGQYAKIQYTTVNNGVTFGGMISRNGVVGPYYATSSANVGWWIRWGTNEPRVTAPTPTTTDTYEMYLNFNNDRIARVDNIIIENSLGSISGNYPSLNLFRRNYSSGYAYLSGKVFSYKITEGTEVVRDFIPCIDENLVPFMFDKVQNTVYLNAGTGQFKVGPNVEKVWDSKKLRKKLALMLANLKKKRPYYCEVEYIESTGTQYIDTGIIPTENTRTLAKLYTTETGNKNWFGGKALKGQGGNYVFNSMSKTSVEYIFGNSQWNVLSASNVVGNPFTLDFSKDGIIINGTSIGTPAYTSFGTGSLTMTLFLRNGGTAYISGRLYYFQIWNNDVLVRDFIPVLDWDYVPCLYDKVSGQFFYNAGTGDFSYGREIHYVDYIESTGTQYIDTGVKLTNNHSVEVDYQLTQASQTRAGLFGALNMSGSNQGRFGSILSPSNSYMEHGYGSGNNYWQQGMPDTNRHKLYQKKNEVYFDGTLIHTFSSATFSLAINAYLGNFVYTNYTPAKAKYYGSRWWDDNELVRDYKPAIDENGVCFWFDRVSHTIYDNAGTDVFLYPARETEYIEVTDLGTTNQSPCIDLGLKYKPSMSIEAKYTRTAMGVSGSVLPLSNSTTPPLIYMPALNASAKTDRFVWRRPSLPEASYYYSFADYPMTVEFKVDAVNDALTVNDNIAKTGMIAAMNGYTDPYESNSNLYMLSINGTYGGMGKVYYLKLYDTTQVYRDLVPVWKDGVAGFLNKVDGTFYSNYKTGTVTCGKILEPDYE